MASSWEKRRTENVDALFTSVVERFIGVQAGEENLGIAHNYCLYHITHHQFPDPDPIAVRDEVEALRERLGMHAQLEKQRALEMLVARLEQTQWHDVDVPDVRARVLLLLLRLSGNPLSTKYTHVDAARVVEGVSLKDTAADVQRIDDVTQSDPQTSESDESDAMSVQSESTLSDWSDDEDTAAARADALDKATAAAAAAARRETRTANKTAVGPSGTKHMDTGTHATSPETGFSWRTLGDALDAAEESETNTKNSKRKDDKTENKTFVSSAPPAPRRNGAGEHVVTAASRLFPALIAARGDDLATNILAMSAGENSVRGDGASGSLASVVAASRRRRTEASAVGDALHALHGVAPVDGSSGPASVPHLSPAALSAALSGAREAAASLDATRRLVRATLDPNASSGPTLRAAAAAVGRIECDIRDSLAPLVLRAAGLQSVSTRGAPTLLELRASTRVVEARARALCALADAALASSPDEGSSARAASRCLDALRRAAATRQTSASDDGQGFVDATRLFCAAAQPYLSALHRWVDTGSLEDPAGELFVCEGTGVRGPIGSEAHWQSGYIVRRGRLGEPECPEFLRNRAEELLGAGKTAGLLRARGPGGSGQTRRKETISAPLPSREHLGLTFCLRVRSALEAATKTPKTSIEMKPSSKPSVVSLDDSGPLVSPLTSIARFIGADETQGSGSVFAADVNRGSLMEEAAATTRLAAFVGDTTGPPSTSKTSSSAASEAAAALDTWLRNSPTPRSPATAPFAAVVVAAAADPARDRARDLSRALMARLRGAWGLGAHLTALRAAYLGGAGEATATFSRVTQLRLDAAEAAAETNISDTSFSQRCVEEAIDRAELEAAFAEAIAADESGTLPDVSAMSLEVLPRGNDEPTHTGKELSTTASSIQLDALARVRLRVEAPWPLALVVPARSAEGYGACAAFLAQLRRARAATEAHATRAWTSSTRRLPGAGGGGVAARQLAVETRHFVSALHEHVLSRVLETSWGVFQSSVERATTLDAARDAHAEFLDSICRQCLVSPDPTWTLLSRQVKAALTAACDLEATGRRADLLSNTSVENTPCASVPEPDADVIAARFRRARSYILRVVDSKLKIGAFPELHELRSRLDFNGFYGAKGGED